MALGKVYCFGPTFRAEKSKTRRHLTEFWMVEPEVAFMDLDGDMELAEDFVSHVVAGACSSGGASSRCSSATSRSSRRCSRRSRASAYDEAIEILRRPKRGSRFEVRRRLRRRRGDRASRSSSTGRSWSTATRGVKAFYMKRDPDDPSARALRRRARARGLRRDHRRRPARGRPRRAARARIAEHKLPQEAFEWYLDLRRYGTVPHAGFGLGIERSVAWICGLHHVRETAAGSAPGAPQVA